MAFWQKFYSGKFRYWQSHSFNLLITFLPGYLGNVNKKSPAINYDGALNLFNDHLINLFNKCHPFCDLITICGNPVHINTT